MNRIVRAVALGFGLSLTATMGLAQDLGIQFAKMPKGTKMYYVASNGTTWVDTFVGKRGRKYVVNRQSITPDGKRQKVVEAYDLKGRLISTTGYNGLVKSGPGKRLYKPFDCAYQVGSCSYRTKFIAHNFSNNGGGFDASVKTVASRDGYTTTETRAGKNGRTRTLFFQLGDYNLRSFIGLKRGSNRNIKLVKIETPK